MTDQRVRRIRDLGKDQQRGFPLSWFALSNPEARSRPDCRLYRGGEGWRNKRQAP